MYRTALYCQLAKMLLLSCVLFVTTDSAFSGTLVGVFDWPVRDKSAFTLTRVTDKDGILERAYERNAKVLLSMKGSRSDISDASGCFSYAIWKDRFDMESSARIMEYFNKGVIVGFYGPDEPHDWSCGPTYNDLGRICDYVHAKIPGLPCGYNAPPLWIKKGIRGTGNIDFIVRQGNFRKVSDWSSWAKDIMSNKKWFAGNIYLSVNGYTGSPGSSEVIKAVKSLCDAKPSGVLIWKWDYVLNFDMAEAISYCANAD